MKKFTLMLFALLFVAVGIAQTQQRFVTWLDSQDAISNDLKKSTKTVTEDVYWEVTFEEETAVWSLGSEEGNRTWAVTDSLDADIVSPHLQYLLPVSRFSESGEKFAWIDGVEDMINETQVVTNSWVQFDGIDLSECSNPQISFKQIYAHVNETNSYLDFSIDDGSTWSSILINDELTANQLAPINFSLFVGDYIGGEESVSIRFRWQRTVVDGDSGHGWEIDDLKIVDNPDVEMELKEGITNFFYYEDYTNPANADYFHFSSHYGMIPEEQFENDAAVIVFNGIVENRGILDVTPDFNVKVLDPDATEIYNQTVTGSNVLSTLDVDTLDVLTELSLGSEPKVGVYTVIYNVIVTDDADIDNNVDTTYFHVTDNMFARDIGNVTGAVSPDIFVGVGRDGNMIGTNYLMLYETTIESLQVFIDDGSTPGASFVAHVMQFDDVSSSWVDLSSSIVVVSEDMLGTWQTVTFPDPIEIMLGDEGALNIKAAIEFYYNGDDNDLMIGYDPSVTSSIWGTNWYFTLGSNANQWISLTNWSRGGVAIRLLTPESNAVANIDAEKIGVYPNPNNGIFTIENVRGADVEVYNLVGQRVYAASNLEQNVKINLSDLSEGTYIVKVSGLNDVKTQKINIVK